MTEKNTGCESRHMPDFPFAMTHHWETNKFSIKFDFDERTKQEVSVTDYLLYRILEEVRFPRKQEKNTMGELLIAGAIILTVLLIGGGVGFWIAWRFF